MRIKKLSKKETAELRQKLQPVFNDLGIILYRKLKDLDLSVEAYGFKLDLITNGKHQWFSSAYSGTEEFIRIIMSKMRVRLKDVFLGWTVLVRRYLKLIVDKLKKSCNR